MLKSIRKIFELIGIKPESIKFNKEEFNGQNLIDVLKNEPRKCPVITCTDMSDYFRDGDRSSIVRYGLMAMVTAGALKGSDFLSANKLLADEWFIKCKNSYGNDPNQPGKIQNNL